MTLRYLLDTNVLSEPVRPTPNAAIMSRIEAHQGEVATASPVWHELLFGCRRLPPSHRRSVLERYLFEVVAASIPILSYDERAADWHAGERARLTAVGRTPAFVDGQIAAIASVNGLTLVTRNHEDFAHFDGLAVEDWTA